MPKNIAKTQKINHSDIHTSWNMELFYKSANDPQIEKDSIDFEKAYKRFAEKYDTKEKAYLTDAKLLLEALNDYENIRKLDGLKPLMYFLYSRDIDSRDNGIAAKAALLENRFTKASNMVRFFTISISQIPTEMQNKFLNDQALAKYRYFLWYIFEDAKHTLSVQEENIIALKDQTSYQMWVNHTNKILSGRNIKWKGKQLPLQGALSKVLHMPDFAERAKLNDLLNQELKSIAEFAEGEINAVFTDKKIDDELRGFKAPYENTIHYYRNDPRVIEKLVEVVTKGFLLSQRFYDLKAKMLKKKALRYCDRSASVGVISRKFTFERSYAKLLEIFRSADPYFADTLKSFIENGQIDVFPKQGKKGGAYCWGAYGNPTFVLLNHTDDFNSYRTFAHEIGHAFHNELSEKLGPIYSQYSTSLAETASTLFEAMALEALEGELTAKEKIILLHDKIQDDISTIFRQIACFNFEQDLHQMIREKGYLPKEEIAAMHNKNMSAYMGKTFKFAPEDGYMFVQWSHIRRPFYVYSYAYGALVSKAMLGRYKKDKSYLKSMIKFLEAGGKDTPENILREVGIDLSSGAFFEEGLAEISSDIDKLEKMIKN